jgi:hypothetical protein
MTAFIFIVTVSLTTRSRVLLEEMPATQLLNNFNILQNLMVHYRVHNRSPLVTILRKVHPVHTTQLNSSKIHFYITLPPMSRSS